MDTKFLEQTPRSFEMPSTAPHKNLRKRVGTAFVSGCLALSLFPALALAQPGDSDDSFNVGDQPMGQMEQAGQPSAMPEGDMQMPQGDFGSFGDLGGFDMQQPPTAPEDQTPGQGQDGNANSMSQQPGREGSQSQQAQPPADGNDWQSDQQPSQDGQMGQRTNQPGQPGQARTDALDAKVKSILESHGVTLPATPGDAQQPGDQKAFAATGEAPELPEGEVNVQQVIDTMRDILREYSISDLEANISDENFVSTLKAYAQTATAQRLAMFESSMRPSMEEPCDLPSEGERPSETAPANDAPGENAGDSLLSQICEIIMDVFGYVS